jgi:streptogramin lyase
MLALLITAAASAAASAAPITEFSTGLPAGSHPSSLTVGPDGNVWFVDTGAIGRITPAGQITEFTAGLNPGSMPHAITAGDDGNLWFTDPGTTPAIGKITPAGQITESSTGLTPGAAPYELTPGSAGTLWFTDPGAKSIGRITVSTGAVKEFDYSTVDMTPNLDEITEGADGNVYFTDKGNVPGIGKITPAGTITESATTPLTSMPSGIGAGPDGNVWFSDQGSPPAIGRVTPAGTVNEFDHTNSGLPTNSAPDEITAGPDGDVWFDDQQSGSDAVGRVTPAGVITEFPTVGTPWKIVDGIDGNLWLLQSQPEAVLRITPTGTLTPFTNGLNAGANLIDTDITVGADGNVWFVDGGTPTAIGRADVLQLAPTAATGAASSIGTVTASVAGTVNPRGAATTVSVQYGGSSVLGSTVSAGTLTASPKASPVTAALASLPAGSTIFYRVIATNAYGTATGTIQTFKTAAATTITTPSKPTTTTATVGDHRIVLITPSPSVCTARTKSLTVKLSSSAIQGSKAAKVRFVSAALFVDRGVKHIRHRTKRSHGKTIRIKVTVFTANKVVRKLPAQPSLHLGGLRSGQHTLNVKLLFRKGRKTPVRKTIRVHLRVC